MLPIAKSCLVCCVDRRFTPRVPGDIGHTGPHRELVEGVALKEVVSEGILVLLGTMLQDILTRVWSSDF